MSSQSPDEGLQFPIHASTKKQSTSRTGQEILSEALSIVDNKTAQQILTEKNWRKNYPTYFKSLVQHGLSNNNNPITIAKQGLHKAHHLFDYFRDGKHYLLKDAVHITPSAPLNTVKFKGESEAGPEWYVPYKGQKLSGQSLLDQIQKWENAGIIEPSHAKALREAVAHPEWFDLSDRTMVLFGAASEAGPLPWLAKWKANIIAVDLPNSRVWGKILNTIQKEMPR